MANFLSQSSGEFARRAPCVNADTACDASSPRVQVGAFGSFRPTIYFSLLTGLTMITGVVCDLLVLPASLAALDAWRARRRERAEPQRALWRVRKSQRPTPSVAVP